ncbi:metal ABC transporter ATP-binding protein [Cohnella luojiensis]|uniref:Metal ABC transporter ATP-binding protein n=1 Tax=Cohnella luojiensis TaxID=652876 RepID=A0A4Y8LZ30_9BACL|nr:metal ABC transporter ATP-binding protein [Cohnella luojiensis]TFE26916.1 metal ABC transporter ATP-binding protein [Cohnella luojiensis]
MLLASMKNVVFGYGDSPCLEDVDIEIHNGEFVAVTGPNGASKTTLLKLSLGLLQPWSGTVARASKRADGKKLVVGYVPQQIAAFNSGFPSTVLEFVLSGTYARGKWFKPASGEDRELSEQALKQVGMWELRNRMIGELSGGQKQRICIARALAQQPDLLVLDEPSNGMDTDSRSRLYALLGGLVKERDMTVVMVTHSLSEASPYLDRIIELEKKEAGGWKCCTTTSCKGHFSPVV